MDLSAYADALGVKTRAPANPPAGSGIVTPDQQRPDTHDGSPSDIAELQQAIAQAPDPASKQTLTALLAQKMAKADQTARLSPYAQALGVSARLAPQEAASQPTPQQIEAMTARPASSQEPGMLESIGAGAGKAMGTGMLGAQQLLGKGISYAGGVGQQPNLSDAIAPQRNIVQRAGDWLSHDAAAGAAKLEGENAPYEEAHPAANMGGQVAGMVLSPLNKVIPGGGATSTLAGAALKGGLQGAALNTLTSPVPENSSFLEAKMQQAGIGAAGGTLGGTLAYGLSRTLSSGIDKLRQVVGKFNAQDADSVVSQALASQGVEKASVTPELFDGLKTQVQEAIKTGKPVDMAALGRLTSAQTLPVPVPMLKGQITRDAMQFAKEKNLRGIAGVGEPITEVLTAQNKALIQNLDALGANKGADVVEAAKPLIESLQSADKKAQSVVGEAYQAYKNHTGKALDVPLGGLAQDYAKTVEEFGDAIPSAIQKKFEGLGLLSGKQTKSFSIDDAEGLIKSINRNYDPSNKVQARALDELRNKVQDAIANGAGSDAQGAEAAFLAKSAREAAALRFRQINDTPAMKDAISGAQPDKFIQKHVLQGNEKEIGNMMDALKAESPQDVDDLRNALMSHIKQRVVNGHSAEDGVFSQDKLKGFVNDPNTRARIAQVLTPEQMTTLKQLNKVAEDALFAPVASAVNTSNTASAAANLIKGEVSGGILNKGLDIAKRFPALSSPAQVIQSGVQNKRAAALVGEAVNPSLVAKTEKMTGAELVQLGSRAGAAYGGANTNKKRQQ